jgi:predicted metalloprotease with PDZ domain
VGLQLTNVLGMGVVVSGVEAGTPAEEAGFRIGDQLLRLDGQDVISATAGNRQLSEAAGNEVSAAVGRDGGLTVLPVRPRTTRDTFYRMIEVEKASALQLAVRRGWLDRETDQGQDRPSAHVRKKKTGRGNEIAKRP